MVFVDPKLSQMDKSVGHQHLMRKRTTCYSRLPPKDFANIIILPINLCNIFLLAHLIHLFHVLPERHTFTIGAYRSGVLIEDKDGSHFFYILIRWSVDRLAFSTHDDLVLIQLIHRFHIPLSLTHHCCLQLVCNWFATGLRLILISHRIMICVYIISIVLVLVLVFFFFFLTRNKKYIFTVSLFIFVCTHRASI